jgi:hypothetical protein
MLVDVFSKLNFNRALAIWLPTTKSQESTQLPYVQVMCDIPLKSFWRGLQLCFRSHLNWRSAHKVMGPQNRRCSNFENLGTPKMGVPRQNVILDVGLVERHNVYYKGEDGGFPQVQAMVSLVSPNLLVAHLSTKSVQTMH